MGFGYKTSWIAVRDRTASQVAEALGLTRLRTLAFREGTELGYAAGLYVAPPYEGWTLAHGRALTAGIDPTSPAFVDWLARLSRTLGEVQYFGTHRVSEWHQWAWARHGEILRVYAFADADTPLFIGEPTAVERDINIGTRPMGEDCEQWTEAEWDAWFATTPSEQHVMQIAVAWSVDPSSLDDDQISGDGIHGHPAAHEHS